MVNTVLRLGLLGVSLAVPALGAAQSNPVQAPPPATPLARSFKVSGIVTGFPAANQSPFPTQLHATLTPMDTSARRINALVAANGAFSIDGVPAGSYVLSFQQCPVRGADCVGGPRGGNTSVTVTNQDVVNLNINFANRSVAIPAPCPPALANRNPALCGPQIGVVGLTPAPAVITPPAVAPSGRPTLLETRLGMIPRAPLTTAKDCGHVPTEKAQTVIACVDEALRAKSPFVASFEQKGIDSIVVIGLGGTAPEGVVQVLFDSNSGAGSGRVSAPRECNGPKLTVAGEAVQVTCQ